MESILKKHWPPEVNTTDEFIECDECHGEGTVEMMNCTRGTASGCCGGCTVDVLCQECQGEKEVENPNFEPFEDE